MPPRIGGPGLCRAWEVWSEHSVCRHRRADCRAFCVPAVRPVQAGEILMTPVSLALITVFFLLLLVTVKPFGLYMANVMEGRPIRAIRVGARFERFIDR